jgi:CheY-like chemotaxis protein
LPFVEPRRVILRADLRDADTAFATYTLDLNDTEVRIATNRTLPLGKVFSIHISFRGLAEPLVLEGVVTDRQTPAADTGPGSAILKLRTRTPSARQALDTLLARLAQPRMLARPHYRALVVEDNGLIRDMFAYGLRRYFREHDSKVTVDYASDGAAAWDRLLVTTYDLAIVDFYLPRLSGAQLVQRIRLDARTADTAVLAISAGGDEARRASLDAGADMFLDKPLTLRNLIATLDGLTNGGAKGGA